MDYALIAFFQLCGIAFQVVPKLMELDKLAVDDSFGDVCKIYWKHDKFTLIYSLFIIVFDEGVHFSVETYAPKFAESFEYYHIMSFGIATILGWGGQRILDKVFGKAEAFINKKIEDKLQ